MLAEAAVKSLKSIITRCTQLGEDIPHAVAAWRNICRQLFFGRRQRQSLPLLDCQLEEHFSMGEEKDKEASRLHKNSNKCSSELNALHTRKECGNSITKQRIGTSKQQSSKADKAAELLNWKTMKGKHITETDDSSDQYGIIPNLPQSTGAT